jgi:hypothetical protein
MDDRQKPAGLSGFPISASPVSAERRAGELLRESAERGERRTQRDGRVAGG